MEIPRHWRLKKQRYALVGEICPHCEVKIFPPRDVCPNCGEEARTRYDFSGKGTIFSYTVMNDAPAGYEAAVPYTVALDPEGKIAIDLGITGVPETFLIDPQGQLVKKWVGPITSGQLNGLLAPLVP